MGFLLSRRWVLFAVAVVLMAWGAWALGQWQFHRLHDRKHSNRVTAVNLNLPPVPVADVLSPHRPPSAGDEWRRVTVHGRWDNQHSVVLKYQTSATDGSPGVDVVTPLVTTGGTAVLVDRGWMGTENSGATRPTVPAATSGDVTVTGWVRRDATGGATKVSDLSTRAISSVEVAKAVPYPLYRGFIDLSAESPMPSKKLESVELPDDTSNGPHFFYGLQWWFFGVLAVFGFCYLAFDELRRHRKSKLKPEPKPTPEPASRTGRPVAGGPSERPEHAAVHGQHGPVDEG